jgi:type I restriction enzyme, S subunit
MNFTFRPLSELCFQKIEQRDPRENPEVEFSYIDIGSINSRTKRIECPKKLKGAQASVRARQVVCINDVLVSTVRPNLNTVALVPPDLNGQICSTGFCLLRCGPELLPDYLFAFVQTHIFVDALKEIVQGTLYPAVTDSQVFAQKIPWVEITKQKSIASEFMAQFKALSTVHTAIQIQMNEAKSLSKKIRGQVQSELADFKRVRLGDAN